MATGYTYKIINENCSFQDFMKSLLEQFSLEINNLKTFDLKEIEKSLDNTIIYNQQYLQKKKKKNSTNSSLYQKKNLKIYTTKISMTHLHMQ